MLSHLQQSLTTLDRSRYSISFELILPHDLWCHIPYSSQQTPWSDQFTGCSQYPQGTIDAFLGPGFNSMSFESINMRVTKVVLEVWPKELGNITVQFVNFDFLLAKFWIKFI